MRLFCGPFASFLRAACFHPTYLATPAYDDALDKVAFVAVLFMRSQMCVRFLHRSLNTMYFPERNIDKMRQHV